MRVPCGAMKKHKSSSDVLHFKGCAEFRLRIALATLSGRAVRITDIRSDSTTPGLSSMITL